MSLFLPSKSHSWYHQNCNYLVYICQCFNPLCMQFNRRFVRYFTRNCGRSRGHRRYVQFHFHVCFLILTLSEFCAIGIHKRPKASDALKLLINNQKRRNKSCLHIIPQMRIRDYLVQLDGPTEISDIAEKQNNSGLTCVAEERRKKLPKEIIL